MKIISRLGLALLLVGCSGPPQKGNASDEGLAAANRDVEVLGASLKGKSPEELIAAFIPSGPHKYGGYEYYYKYMVNIEIRRELKTRGSAAYPALRSHINDNTYVWEAINGPGDTVGRICKELLEE